MSTWRLRHAMACTSTHSFFLASPVYQGMLEISLCVFLMIKWWPFSKQATGSFWMQSNLDWPSLLLSFLHWNGVWTCAISLRCSNCSSFMADPRVFLWKAMQCLRVKSDENLKKGSIRSLFFYWNSWTICSLKSMKFSLCFIGLFALQLPKLFQNILQLFSK